LVNEQQGLTLVVFITLYCCSPVLLCSTLGSWAAQPGKKFSLSTPWDVNFSMDLTFSRVWLSTEGPLSCFLFHHCKSHLPLSYLSSFSANI